MPPKSKAAAGATSTDVFIVLNESSGEVDSVHATLASANAAGIDDALVIRKELVGGSISISEAPKKEKPVAKPKASKAKAAAKVESAAEDDDDDEEEDEAPEEKAPKAKASKTKGVAEQRAANASKAKPSAKDADANLPENVKALLAGSGDVLDGLTIVVTGVPPTIGRKNAEKLVQIYGGKLTKSLSKNTNFVVVGNDAGPKKLDQITDLGIETLTEDTLIAMLEGGGGGGGGAKKRAAGEETGAKTKKAKK